jgi:hypothetical protein
MAPSWTMLDSLQRKTKETNITQINEQLHPYAEGIQTQAQAVYLPRYWFAAPFRHDPRVEWDWDSPTVIVISDGPERGQRMGSYDSNCSA